MRDFAKWLERATEDFEFSREWRYFDGTLQLVDGDNSWRAKFEDGALAEAVKTDGPSEGASISISGGSEHWAEMLKEYPKPFYQCLQTTAVRHGIQISVTNQTFAYLPALNRMTALFRQYNNEEA